MIDLPSGVHAGVRQEFLVTAVGERNPVACREGFRGRFPPGRHGHDLTVPDIAKILHELVGDAARGVDAPADPALSSHRR